LDVSFIVSLSKEALSHRKPAPAYILHDICWTQENDQRATLYWFSVMLSNFKLGDMQDRNVWIPSQHKNV
jgi:hypothetical protein